MCVIAVHMLGNACMVEYCSNANLACCVQLLDDIVPTLVARAEALEKRARAAAKVAAQLNNVVPDDNGHYGRSRRQRTQVMSKPSK